jgi:hypothetical protein
VPPQQSFTFRLKKQSNDLLRRLTGYQFVKADKLDTLKAAAKRAKELERFGRPR